MKCALDVHCRRRYPREFANMSESGRRFSRNMYVSDLGDLYNYIEFFDFVNCFASVYSFDAPLPEMGVMWPRDRVVIDALFMDFDSKESPKLAFKDVLKVLDFLESRSVEPLVYFSGSKGFHVYVIFEPVKLQRPKDVLKRVAVTLVELLELKTADLNVAEIARLSRLPFTLNSKSKLYCTPISPKRLKNMTYDDVIRFVKSGKYDLPHYEESGYFREAFEYVSVMLEELEREAGQRKKQRKVKPAKGRWKKRIEHYVSVLKEHGVLSADPRIVKIHSKSEYVASMPEESKRGAIEHIARVHLVFMLLEEGYSDEEIHEIFSYAKDYKREKTQYFIDYNRRRLEQSRIEGG
ncbi:bifunctional DNA primase/polymerase [Archaeoglobus neptunius]|uniref:hypothetical protein n=1 Tax=Archaeoglobus neptunius TaxID=2798580 RepID=UPI001929411A|nr:hypothetical protein [Archaeoglobus neptunius]